MPFFGRRVAEVLIFEIVLSIIFTIAIQFIGATDLTFFLSMLICLAINIVYMFICLRGYFFTVSRYRFYYKVNLTAYAVLAVINIIMELFNFEPFYTYMFFPYKLFIPLGFSKTVSTLAINAIFVAIIFIVPLISRVSEKDDDKDLVS